VSLTVRAFSLAAWLEQQRNRRSKRREYDQEQLLTQTVHAGLGFRVRALLPQGIAEVKRLLAVTATVQVKERQPTVWRYRQCGAIFQIMY